MRIDKISLASIKEIISFVDAENFDCKCLLKITEGQVSAQQASGSINSLIIKSVSDTIATIVVGCVINKIQSITFYGDIDITPSELYSEFVNYRENYLLKDDFYFYIFNEDKKSGNYILSFFEPSHIQVNVAESHESLSNIILSW
jgi:hypothetical protein